MGLRKWMTLMGVGAGLMYFYDPEQGQRRRTLLSNEWTHLQREGQGFWARMQRELQARRDGMRAEQSFMSDSYADTGGLFGNRMPSMGMLGALAGGLMTFYGVARGGLMGTAAAFMGLKLLSRSRSEQDQYAMGGPNGDRARHFAGDEASFRNQGSQPGRFDRVGQTGVYAASDPNAPEDAQAQGMASWGQGERGAAGYEDSGGSELNLGDEPGGFDSVQPSNPGPTGGE